MEPLFLPVLHSFENNNIFTGSYGALRFRVTPSIVMLTQKEVNFDESSMKCECWHGENCYEKSEMEDENHDRIGGWRDRTGDDWRDSSAYEDNGKFDDKYHRFYSAD